jgi:hypothetical protein
MTYACLAWELAADTYLLKLEHLKNKVLCTIGSIPRCTPVHDLHTAFNMSYEYVHDCITNYTGNRQKSHKITRMNLFAAQDNAKPDIENI